MYNIKKLEQNEAETIVSWNYGNDYQWTNIDEGSENRMFLLNEKYRGDHYYAIYSNDELIGFFSLNTLIREEVGGLQLVFKPGFESIEALTSICDYIVKEYEKCEYINAMCFSNQDKAIDIYEKCGFENKGIVSAPGHDMESYEQEGFDSTKGINSQIQLVILSKKIR